MENRLEVLNAIYAWPICFEYHEWPTHDSWNLLKTMLKWIEQSEIQPDQTYPDILLPQKSFGRMELEHLNTCWGWMIEQNQVAFTTLATDDTQWVAYDHTQELYSINECFGFIIFMRISNWWIWNNKLKKACIWRN